jgi:hypothetical protein
MFKYVAELGCIKCNNICSSCQTLDKPRNFVFTVVDFNIVFTLLCMDDHVIVTSN